VQSWAPPSSDRCNLLLADLPPVCWFEIKTEDMPMDEVEEQEVGVDEETKGDEENDLM